jgi:hypothetical protein
MSLPDNQRKLDAVRQLSQLAKGAGVSMIELPLTSAPLGDRSVESHEYEQSAVAHQDAPRAKTTARNRCPRGW